MPFGLPARDEANWDTKLNDSINAVKATADAAETPAGAQAKADAAAAASIPLAQKNAASGVAPLDAGSLVPQANLPAHLTPAELSATVASQVTPRQVVYVDALTGNDANSGGSPGRAKQTIAAGVSALGGAAGKVLVQVGLYEVTATIPLNSRQEIAGWGGRSNVSGGSETGNNGVTVRAMPGFVGDYVFDHPDGAVGDSWHWGLLEGIGIDGNKAAGVNVGGVHVFEFGEETAIRRVAVYNCAKAGYLLTGTHAVGHMEHFSAWSCDDYGVKIIGTSAGAPGGGGSVRMIGSSGDHNAPGWLYHDGSCSITELSPKHEDLASASYAWWTLGGSQTGGGRARLNIVGGIANTTGGGGVSGGDLVRITGTCRPSVVIQNLHAPGIGNVINDQAVGDTIAASSSNAPVFVTWAPDGSEAAHIRARNVDLGPIVRVRGTSLDTNPSFRLTNHNSDSYDVWIKSLFSTYRVAIGTGTTSERTLWQASSSGHLLSVYNGSTRKDVVTLDEQSLKLIATSVALPTADASNRGQIRRIEGGAGAADRIVICRKDAADAYAWVDLF